MLNPLTNVELNADYIYWFMNLDLSLYVWMGVLKFWSWSALESEYLDVHRVYQQYWSTSDCRHRRCHHLRCWHYCATSSRGALFNSISFAHSHSLAHTLAFHQLQDEHLTEYLMPKCALLLHGTTLALRASTSSCRHSRSSSYSSCNSSQRVLFHFIICI